jgi:predicted ABC-type sugar transport system permease subunit
VGLGFGVGVAVAVGAGLGDAAMTSGDGTDAGELAALALATALSAGLASGELAGLAIAESRVAALVGTAGDSTADDPADDG